MIEMHLEMACSRRDGLAAEHVVNHKKLFVDHGDLRQAFKDGFDAGRAVNDPDFRFVMEWMVRALKENRTMFKYTLDGPRLSDALNRYEEDFMKGSK